MESLVSIVKCNLCGNTYKSNNALRKHFRTKHQQSGTVEETSQETNQFFVTNALTCNLPLFHSDQTGQPEGSIQASFEKTTERREFKSFEEFKNWKESEEDRTNSCYAKERGDTKTVKGVVRQYYHCHRSGSYQSTGRGIRELKAQGTCKSGRKCHSNIRAKILPSGRVEVSYMPKHSDHENNTAHLTIRQKDRQHIAGMLASGISLDAVLDKIQAGISSDSVTPMHFVTKKSLHNIARDFKIQMPGVLDEDDSQSVRLCIGSYEEVELCEQPPFTPNTEPDETEVILRSLQKPNIADFKAQMEEICRLVTSEADQNGEMCRTACDHLSRLKTVLSAMGNRPETPRFPPPSPLQQPANKKTPTQRRLFSVKTSFKKRKADASLSKPSTSKKDALLHALSGAGRDHDYL